MKKTSQKSTSTSVRFDARDKERLQRVAKQLGVKPADIIRLAVNRHLDMIEKDGKIEIPLKS